MTKKKVIYLISKNVKITEYQDIQTPQKPPVLGYIVLDRKQPAAKTVKFKNIKVDLRYLLDSVFTAKSLKGSNLVWTFLGILKTILHFMQDMQIQLGRQEAIVLFALYRLRAATDEEIAAYIMRLKENGEIEDVQDLNITKALDKLETIKTIELEEGKYSICETVFIKRYKS